MRIKGRRRNCKRRGSNKRKREIETQGEGKRGIKTEREGKREMGE